jgi:hypothetical protein
VEEISTIHVEPASAEFPVGTQEEVVPEEPVILFIQHTAADQAEVGHVFFLLTGINAPPPRAGAEFPGHGSEGRASFSAIPEPAQASSKNGPKNAVAGRLPDSVDKARPIAFTILTAFNR